MLLFNKLKIENINITLIVWIIIATLLLVLIIVLLALYSKKRMYRRQIRTVIARARGLWKTALQNSADYMMAMGLDPGHIESMDRSRITFRILTDLGELTLIAKSTCGANYGDGWRTILQARTEDENINFETEGGGTSFIAVLNPIEHQSVLKAIKDGKVTMVENEHLWP